MCERQTRPADAHPALHGVGEQLGHRRPAVAQPLVRVAAPVGEEQVVAGVECRDRVDQPVEVGAAVHERLDEVALGPRGQRRVGLPRSSAVSSHSSGESIPMITSRPVQGRKHRDPRGPR